MVRKSLWLLTLLVLAGCSAWEEKTVTVRFPVPEESVQNVMKFFKELDPRNMVSARFVPFDARIDSHPRISGYIELTGKAEIDGIGDTKETLAEFVNGLKSKKLLPVDEVYWQRDGNEFRWLEEYVQKNEKRGIKHQYIVLSKDRLRLIYNNHEASVPDPMLEGVAGKGDSISLIQD